MSAPPVDRLPVISTTTFRGRGSAEVFEEWKLVRTVRITGGPFQNLADVEADALFTPFHHLPTMVVYPDPTVLSGNEAMWGLYVAEEVFEGVQLAGAALRRPTGLESIVCGMVGLELLARAGLPPARVTTIAKYRDVYRPGSDGSWWKDLVDALPPLERVALASDPLERPSVRDLLHYLRTGTLKFPRKL